MTPDGFAKTIPISLGKASMPALAAALAPLVGSAIQLSPALRRACRWVFIRMKATNASLSRPGRRCRNLESFLHGIGYSSFKDGAKKIATGGSHMATQIVMDRSGDTIDVAWSMRACARRCTRRDVAPNGHYFDARDKKALRDAEFRFKALTGAGYTAAVRNAEGEASVLRSFDPNAEETLFFPRLVGG
jgi:hypothetical protein